MFPNLRQKSLLGSKMLAVSRTSSTDSSTSVYLDVASYQEETTEQVFWSGLRSLGVDPNIYTYSIVCGATLEKFCKELYIQFLKEEKPVCLVLDFPTWGDQGEFRPMEENRVSIQIGLADGSRRDRPSLMRECRVQMIARNEFRTDSQKNYQDNVVTNMSQKSMSCDGKEVIVKEYWCRSYLALSDYFEPAQKSILELRKV
jgi:hypothetical protein